MTIPPTSPPSRSPAFDEPGAVAPQPRTGEGRADDGQGTGPQGRDTGPDVAVPAHYGDPFREQRAMTRFVW